MVAEFDLKPIADNSIMLPLIPPPLPTSTLKFSAKIDFLTVSNCGIKNPLPPLDGMEKWHLSGRRLGGDWSLTIHDPTRNDILKVIEHYENPMVMALELAVDLMPKESLEGALLREHLTTTYQAVAARFRPEDAALWAYGKRGSVAGKKQPIMPLERRFAPVGQQVVYGHRGEMMQAKLYWKTQDQHLALPEAEQSIRMELFMPRIACMDERLGIDRLSDLLTYKYRLQFTKHFRIIAEPRARKLRGLTDFDLARRQKAMLRAWRLAGVAKFAIPTEFPEESLPLSINAITKRQRIQLPNAHFKLMRDQEANAKIGVALMNLQRRMAGS